MAARGVPPADGLQTFSTPDDAVSVIPAGATVFVGGFSGHPTELMAALVRQAARLRPLRLITALMLPSESPLSRWPGAFCGNIDLLYAGPAIGTGIAEGWARYLPIHLSLVPELLEDGSLPIDAVCVQVSPPDADGRCHFGLSVDVLPEAVAAAGTVVAEINPALPRPTGSGWIPRSSINAAVQVAAPLPNYSRRPPNDVERSLAEQVARLVPDEATLQFGIGAVMEAVADALQGRKDLGIHSSLMTDGLMRLMQAGAVTNTGKGIDDGRSVATMAIGTPELYGFINDNAEIALEPVSYTHNENVLGRIQKLTAINSAFEVDLSGAVNAEVAGGRLVGGVGGQVDFARGARRSSGGRFIVAFPSTAAEGTRSRIVRHLSGRAPVTTARSDTQWIVTEHGAVDVSALCLEERAEALVQIAHPAHRRWLAGAS